MEKFVVEGGRQLSGELPVMGSKNAATKLMAASLLFDHPVSFANIPQIADVRKTSELLEKLGAEIHYDENGILKINGTSANSSA